MSRKIKIVWNIKCTEEKYEDTFKEIKNDILSGKMQREMSDNGIKFKATYREYK